MDVKNLIFLPNSVEIGRHMAKLLIQINSLLFGTRCSENMDRCWKECAMEPKFVR